MSLLSGLHRGRSWLRVGVGLAYAVLYRQLYIRIYRYMRVCVCVRAFWRLHKINFFWARSARWWGCKCCRLVYVCLPPACLPQLPHRRLWGLLFGGCCLLGKLGAWGQHSWRPAARRLAYLSCQLALLLLLRALHSFSCSLASCHLPLATCHVRFPFSCFSGLLPVHLH